MWQVEQLGPARLIPRDLLRRADFDRGTPALGDQPEQHGLRIRFTVRLRLRRKRVKKALRHAAVGKVPAAPRSGTTNASAQLPTGIRGPTEALAECRCRGCAQDTKCRFPRIVRGDRLHFTIR